MLSFRILGPLEVLRDGRPLPLGAARQRALLACLLLPPNEVVSSDRLIDDLWGDDPPPTAEHMLHVYVSRLRKALEDEGGGKVLVTRSPGYVLELGSSDEVDAAVFESLVRRGRERVPGSPEDALSLLERALGLWRGAALADFAFDAFAQPSAARLEELRAVAEEERIEALLALGRHEETIPELEMLVARYPLRERLRGQQMLALYRSGRQADALAAYQAARHALADELGVDPGPALEELEAKILRHDPDLQAPERVRPPTSEPAAPPPAPPRRTRGLVAGAVSAVVLVAVLVVVILWPSDGEPEAGREPTPSTSSASPSSHPDLRLDWTEVPGATATFGGPGDQVMLGGARTADRYLAFGYTAGGQADAITARDYDAAVWMATAPTRWEPVEAPAFEGPGNQRATDAAVLEDRLVVVGADGSSGDRDGAVWVSDDQGSTWRRVGITSPAFRQPGEQEMRDVTRAETAGAAAQLVAVGYSDDGDDEDASVWTSMDGSTWSWSVTGGLGGPLDQQMDSVVAFDGLIVAGGFAYTSRDEDAAVWVSRDGGGTWERVKDAASLEGAGNQQINALAVGGPGLVAVGLETLDGDTDAAVWTSTDGSDWVRVKDPSARFGGPGPQVMYAVTSSVLGIVAAGADGLGSDSDGAVWTSIDGRTWLRLGPNTPAMSAFTDYGGEAVKVLIPAPGRFLALGAENHGTERDADAWVGQPLG